MTGPGGGGYGARKGGGAWRACGAGIGTAPARESLVARNEVPVFSRLTIALAAVVATVVAAGCGDDVTVASPRTGQAETRYTLTSIEGQPLPALYAQNRQAADRVRAGTLSLTPDGRGLLSLTIVDATNGRPRVDDGRLTYTRRAERIEVSLECADAGACIAPPHLFGRVSERRIVFDSSRITRAPLVFDRVEP